MLKKLPFLLPLYMSISGCQLNKSIPKTKPPKAPDRPHKDWWNEDCQHALERSKYWNKRYTRERSELIQNEYKAALEHQKVTINKAKLAFNQMFLRKV